MSGENIPIDYISDRLEKFDLNVAFVSGKGYIGSIKFNNIQVYKQDEFKSDPQPVFDTLCSYLEKNYITLMTEM